MICNLLVQINYDLLSLLAHGSTCILTEKLCGICIPVSQNRLDICFELFHNLAIREHLADSALGGRVAHLISKLFKLIHRIQGMVFAKSEHAKRLIKIFQLLDCGGGHIMLHNDRGDLSRIVHQLGDVDLFPVLYCIVKGMGKGKQHTRGCAILHRTKISSFIIFLCSIVKRKIRQSLFKFFSEIVFLEKGLELAINGGFGILVKLIAFCQKISCNR